MKLFGHENGDQQYCPSNGVNDITWDMQSPTREFEISYQWK